MKFKISIVTACIEPQTNLDLHFFPNRPTSLISTQGLNRYARHVRGRGKIEDRSHYIALRVEVTRDKAEITAESLVFATNKQ